MSRKYSSWASNQPLINPDLSMMRLMTVMGNEQDQLKNIEKVEAIPHMYINVDAPPAPTTRIDARAMQPTMISRQSSSYFAAPTAHHPSSNNVQTKIWPAGKPSNNSSSFESASSTSKRHHKHKHHHHHHHHGDKHHHHHRHHSRKHRAKSAESIRNRQHQAVISPTKMIITNPQYIEQDQQQYQQQYQQQQQQQQPMIVYREVPNGEGYTVDTNGLATVPYGQENETNFVDDQQAPMIVYREQQPQHQHQSIMTDGLSQQQIFFNPEQETTIGSQNIPLQPIENKFISQRVASVNETQVGNYSPFICTQSSPNLPVTTGYIQEIERIYIEDDCCLPTVNCVSQCCMLQQTDPFACFPQQQSSQILYCTDPNHQDYLCASSNHNILQQSVSSPQQQQQQFVCLDNTSTTIQPTMINQIPVFNPLSANNTCQSIVNLPQASLQRAASVVMQQPQHQPLQIIQQPQQQLQLLQQSQPLQIIQQPQAGQFLQFAQAQAPMQQVLQTVQPQVMQGQSVLQTIQIPTQTVSASPQILYQRPYDPVVMPIQNQQVAIAQAPLVALSQPSYAPSRIVSATPGGQPPHGANMFRHALLRTVADRTGVPVGGQSVAGVQLMQPVAGGGAAPVLSNPNLLIAGGVQRSASLPIVPLTPGGLLIPFQPSQTPGLKPGLLPRAGGYPSTLRNFDDIRRQMQAQRTQLLQNLQQQQQNYSRIPSPPVLSATPRNPSGPYSSGNILASGARSSGSSLPPVSPLAYARPLSTGLPYSQPSFAGSTSGSAMSAPYNPLRT